MLGPMRREPGSPRDLSCGRAVVRTCPPWRPPAWESQACSARVWHAVGLRHSVLSARELRTPCRREVRGLCQALEGTNKGV